MAIGFRNCYDPPNAALVIADATAITVDLISAEGTFLGGTIAPGLQ